MFQRMRSQLFVLIAVGLIAMLAAGLTACGDDDDDGGDSGSSASGGDLPLCLGQPEQGYAGVTLSDTNDPCVFDGFLLPAGNFVCRACRPEVTNVYVTLEDIEYEGFLITPGTVADTSGSVIGEQNVVKSDIVVPCGQLAIDAGQDFWFEEGTYRFIIYRLSPLGEREEALCQTDIDYEIIAEPFNP